MMIGHMGETHWIPVQFNIFFDFDMSAWMLRLCIQTVKVALGVSPVFFSFELEY